MAHIFLSFDFEETCGPLPMTLRVCIADEQVWIVGIDVLLCF